jgi:hypothetical protein
MEATDLMAPSGLANNLYQLPYEDYAAQQRRYVPDLESSILNMFGQYGVDVSRYGGGAYADPQSRLARIANELRSGQRSFSDVERSLGLAASELSPEQRRANQTAAYEFNPAWQQLNRSLDQLSSNRTRDVNAANMFGQYGGEALGQVYGRLGEQFTQNRAAVQSAYDAARQGTQAAFDQGNQVAQTAAQAAQAQNAGLAQSLGVQGAVVDPNADLNSAVSQMLQNSGTESANAQSVLQALQSSNYGINTQAMNDAASEGALRQSQLQNTVGSMLSEIMSNYSNQNFDILGQLSDLESSRGSRTAELLNQFQDQSYDRRQQEMLNSLAAEIQRGTLDLQRQQFGFDRDLGWAQHGLDRELGFGELRLRQQQIQSELMSTMDPLRRRQLELENALLEQQLAGGGPNSPTMGQAAVDRMLSTLHGPYPQGQDPGTIFNSLRTAAQSAIMNDPRYGGDPFAAFEYLLSSGSNPNPAIDSILRQLAELYWGANG